MSIYKNTYQRLLQAALDNVLISHLEQIKEKKMCDNCENGELRSDPGRKTATQEYLNQKEEYSKRQAYFASEGNGVFITPEMIYPKGIVIPDGWEKSHFGLAKKKEFYLGTAGLVCEAKEDLKSVRWILKKREAYQLVILRYVNTYGDLVFVTGFLHEEDKRFFYLKRNTQHGTTPYDKANWTLWDDTKKGFFK